MKVKELIKELEEFYKNYGNKNVIFKNYIRYNPMIGNYPYYDDKSVKFISFDNNYAILTENKYEPKNPVWKTEEEEKENEEIWNTILDICNIKYEKKSKD